MPSDSSFVSHLTGQSAKGKSAVGYRSLKIKPQTPKSKSLKAKNFSFSVDFFRNQLTIDQQPWAAAKQNEERLAGHVAHPFEFDTRTHLSNNKTLKGASTRRKPKRSK